MGFQAAATTPLHCSSPAWFPHLPAYSSRTFATAVSSPSSRRRPAHRYQFCAESTPKSRSRPIRRALRTSFDPFSDELGEELPEGIVATSIVSRQKKWRPGCMQAGETAYCSVKKAFTSTVFIILELHSFALQMREFLYYEDLQGILAVVQKEIHASFVWLFQKVFSCTPTLMVYIMIFLANYSVYSMSTAVAVSPASPVQAQQASAIEDQKNAIPRTESSTVGKSTLSSSNGKTISIGGSGGSKYRAVGSDPDEGDDRFNKSNRRRTVFPNENSSGTGKAESVSFSEEEESRGFVSSANNEIKATGFSGDHFRTEMQYHMEMAQEPNNSLLLANFAQFLYLVAKDLDRAEEYFKRATKIEPKDAEALNKYAHFLWEAKNDLWAAEETFLEAIETEPENPFYPAEYAHFLWTTGGEDTCSPLS